MVLNTFIVVHIGQIAVVPMISQASRRFSPVTRCRSCRLRIWWPAAMASTRPGGEENDGLTWVDPAKVL